MERSCCCCVTELLWIDDGCSIAVASKLERSHRAILRFLSTCAAFFFHVTIVAYLSGLSDEEQGVNLCVGEVSVEFDLAIRFFLSITSPVKKRHPVIKRQ